MQMSRNDPAFRGHIHKNPLRTHLSFITALVNYHSNALTSKILFWFFAIILELFYIIMNTKKI